MAAEIAINPLHHRPLVGYRPFGYEIVDIVGPVLDRGISTTSMFFDNDLDDCRVQALGGVHRSRTAFNVVHLRPLVDDDQGSFKLPHTLGINSEIRLQRKIYFDPFGYVNK